MKYLSSLILFLAAISFTSCKSDFTSLIRQDFSRHNIPVSQVQFYNSEKIVLIREEKIDERKAASGEFVKNKRNITRYVYIKSGTPGVCLKETDSTLNVTFDSNDDTLPFTLKGDKYVLDTQDGKVAYSGKEFKVEDGANTYLKIIIDESEKERDREKVVSGRKIK